MKKRFSEEQIVAILREGSPDGQQSIGEVCRKHGISQPTFYAWRRKYGNMPESEVKRLRELEKENGRLKRLLAERDVEIDVMRELLQKK
jgi:putative transposase